MHIRSVSTEKSTRKRAFFNSIRLAASDIALRYIRLAPSDIALRAAKKANRISLRPKGAISLFAPAKNITSSASEIYHFLCFQLYSSCAARHWAFGRRFVLTLPAIACIMKKKQGKALPEKENGYAFRSIL
ncbi:MAG: hypothetical protein ACOYJY_00130 [Acutalibacteraceae bacterium]